MLSAVASVPSAPNSTTGLRTNSFFSQTRTSLQPQRSQSVPAPLIPDGTLRLRGGPIHNRRVTWSEDVIDNEGMGRKKSKACCIHRPAREFGESSDESSDDSSSSDESDTETKRRSQPVKGHKGCNGDHKHNLNRDGNGQKKSRRRPPSPNAYERMPKIQSKTLPQKSAK